MHLYDITNSESNCYRIVKVIVILERYVMGQKRSISGSELTSNTLI